MAIVVLAAIALLFFLGVSCGALQDDTAAVSDVRDGWTRTLNDLIGRKPSISIDDLSTQQLSCLQNEQLRIPAAGGCGYTIQAEERAVRELSLRLVGGSNATVAVQQDDFSEDALLTGGQSAASFDVLPDDPATVVITCAAAVPCTLVVD